MVEARKNIRLGFTVGAIAGAIVGLIPFTIIQIDTIMGLYEWIGFETSLPSLTDLTIQALDHISINALWGAVFGAFFGLVYDSLLGKGYRRGIFIGLVYFTFGNLRAISFIVIY
ncbi:MAG: hypothetical protein NWF08_08080 [Candidatus Bathyarchaeota archaeon]|nr:hypothetical protein [Candidatus Bathyarchaeota archaeon]